MDEKKAEEIKTEAKNILDKFSRALDKVNFKEKEFKKEIGGFRKEGEGSKMDESFRKIMFDNASSKDENCIIAEKKSW